jgi:hypothetical protein
MKDATPCQPQLSKLRAKRFGRPFLPPLPVSRQEYSWH